MQFLSRSEFYTVLVYLLLMLAIGWYYARRNKGGIDFFVGGRAIPWWVSGISLYMGNFSAWLFTGGAGMIYRTTWYGLLYFLLTGAVSYFLGSQMTAVQWRRSRVISPVEFTRTRFGISTQQTLGIITSVVFIAAAGNQLRAISSVVESVLGVPIEAAAITIGVFVILYTFLGGVWAVMVTDVVQFVVLISVSLLVGPLALRLVDGGLPQIFAAMDFSIPPLDGLPSHDIHFLVAGVISFTLGVASGQGARFYCVPDEKQARKVGMLAALLFLTTPILFSLPSLVARSIWGGPAQLAAHISGANPHEQVFVAIAMKVLPPGLVGVFLAAMFAATMSALDTVYNQVASVLSRDMYMHFRPDTDDRGLIRIGRIMTVIIGVVTVLLCLFYISGSADLFTVMTDIFYMAAPVTAAPLLMGLLYRKAPRFAGIASMIWGVATGVITGMVLHWNTGIQVYLTQALCIGIFLLSPWLGSMWGNRDGRITVITLTATFMFFLGGVLSLGSSGTENVIISLSGTTLQTGIPESIAILLYCLFMGASMLYFAKRFSTESSPESIVEFYRKLDTRVDIGQEVSGSRKAALDVYRIVGLLTFVISGLVLCIGLLEYIFTGVTDPLLYGLLIVLLGIFGSLFLFAGKWNQHTDEA